MDNLVKQRLVGALILTALAVIFWPIIFVAPKDRASSLTVTVPPAPPVDRTPISAPDNAGMRQGSPATAQAQSVPDVAWPGDPNASLADAVEAPLPDSSETLPLADLDEARETLTEPELDADGLPIAFSLQVATVSDGARAEQLRDRLIDAGYKAYMKRLRRGEKTFYRVLVGPRFSRDELLPVKAAVDESYRVESMIIRYLP